MPYEMIVTLLVLVFLLIALLQERVGAEIVMLVALLILVSANVISVKDALAGFANEAILTIGALFVVGAGLQSTGAVEHLAALLLGKPKPGSGLLRLLAPVAALSAFMNNTPLVAMFLPIFVHLAKKLRVSPSKLLLPLSYAAIMGGTCTLIGTSTNLVVHGQMEANGMAGMGMFELAPIGVPVTIIGLLYLVMIGQRSLPDRKDLIEYVEANPREFTVELVVEANCPLIGKTIRESGLRDLPGLYVYGLERSGQRQSPVDPEMRLQVNDLLCFSGIVSTIVDAQKIRGLVPVEHHVSGDYAEMFAHTEGSFDSMEGIPALPQEAAPRAAPRSGRQLTEVVVSPASPLIGRKIRDTDFRAHYQASILAVHRSGAKLDQKIGQIELQAGDTLLVDAGDDFTRRWRNSREFILVSGLADTAPVDHRRAWLALGIFAGVVVGMTIWSGNAVLPCLIGAAAMIVSGCLTGPEAQRQIDLSVLLLVACALGVSKALDKSGAAEWLAGNVVGVVQQFGPIAVLAAIVVLTGVLTELLSNNACAGLMTPLVVAIAKQTDMDPRPLLLAVAAVSSYGFATPFGYQTNLMVLNPGGYKFIDYLRVGIPIDLICWVLTILIVPLIWTLK